MNGKFTFHPSKNQVVSGFKEINKLFLAECSVVIFSAKTNYERHLLAGGDGPLAARG